MKGEGSEAMNYRSKVRIHARVNWERHEFESILNRGAQHDHDH